MIPEKQLLLDEIKGKISLSKAMIVTKYNAFSPATSWNFASSLRENKGEFEVVKKRLFVKAAKECGHDDLDVKDLDGNIGVVFINGDNLVEVTKAVYGFIKENEDKLEVIRGNVENKTYSKEEMKKLSQLPGKQEMRAQFLGLLEAPMGQTLSVMNALLTSVIYCIDEKIKKER